ncbi:MAG: riboflavin synthase [Gemmatimonadota bacterium]
MFTGLVETVGRVERCDPFEEGIRFRIGSAELGPLLSVGDSIAVDGVCQTVVSSSDDSFEVEAVRTTLSRTTMGQYEPSRPVNLERPVRAGDELGGHLVQGHVDAVGTVTEVRPAGETVFISVALPEEVARVTVALGSLAVDGISLTVNALADGVAELAIIPHTWHHTNMDRLSPGAGVNLEADLIGKYVERLLSPYIARL